MVGILGMCYWAWVVGGINAALIVVWANALPGLKDFLDYMGSTLTSAINLSEQQVSISNPSSPPPPEISSVAEQTVAEHTPLLDAQQQRKSKKNKKNKKNKK